MSIKSVLFGKVDLDTLLASYLMGARMHEPSVSCRAVRGSAAEEELSDPTVLTVEVGGSGRVAENNFDHHGSDATVDLSSARQVLDRLSRLVQYVDELDRGHRRHEDGCRFPSLAQLVAGMLLSVEAPEEQMREGHRILAAVIESGIDPYGSMEPILDELPDGRAWAEAKRTHDHQGAQAISSATWSTTAGGLRLAAVETEWFGAPGALMGQGADVVVCRNPAHGDQKVSKFTVAVRRDRGLTVTPALEELRKLEEGWGGPAHKTICGSPQGRSSVLGLEGVIEIVCSTL